MLSEILDHLLTPCPRYTRSMGYLSEALAIRSRYRRCRDAWAGHLRHTRDTILRAAARCERRRKAVVLGGGLLHDVPLAEVAAGFREVYLVDVVPLRSTRRFCRRFPNVVPLAADVTGTAETVYRIADDPDASLPRAEPKLFCDDPEVDLVASVNLLSQLPYIPTRYLDRWGAHAASDIDAYGRDLIRAHIDYLNRVPGRVALVTDVERLKIDRGGIVVERSGLLYGVDLGRTGEEWVWELAPRGEADRRFGHCRRVVGIAEWR